VEYEGRCQRSKQGRWVHAKIFLVFGAGQADSSVRRGGLLHPEYRGSGQCGVRAKSNGHCDKESDRAEIKPVDGNQRTPCVREQADGIRRHGPDDTSEPLRWPRLRFTWRSLVRSTFAGLIRKRMFFMASPRKFHKL